MLPLFKHLLPRAKAWILTKIDKRLRQLFEGLSAALVDELREYFDLIWLDMFPEHTTSLTQWESTFGLSNPGLTETVRRSRLDSLWKASGGQDPYYIQNTLRDAGFDVYVHPWWETLLTDGDMEASGVGAWTAINSATLTKETTDPYEGLQVLRCARNGVPNPSFQQLITVAGQEYHITGWARSDGVSAPYIWITGGLGDIWNGSTSTDWQAIDVRYTATGETHFRSGTISGTQYCEWDDLMIQTIPVTVRNPFVAVGSGYYGCDDAVMQCGELLAQCGASHSSNGYMLVNKLYTAVTDLTCLCGEDLMQCGESSAQCGENDGFIFERVLYEIPPDPADWPWIVYIGGVNWGDEANIPAERREEFEDLILKIIPAHLWVALVIRYPEVVIERSSGEDIFVRSTGFPVVVEA